MIESRRPAWSGGFYRAFIEFRSSNSKLSRSPLQRRRWRRLYPHSRSSVGGARRDGRDSVSRFVVQVPVRLAESLMSRQQVHGRHPAFSRLVPDGRQTELQRQQTAATEHARNGKSDGIPVGPAHDWPDARGPGRADGLSLVSRRRQTATVFLASPACPWNRVDREAMATPAALCDSSPLSLERPRSPCPAPSCGSQGLSSLFPDGSHSRLAIPRLLGFLFPAPWSHAVVDFRVDMASPLYSTRLIGESPQPHDKPRRAS